MNPIDWQRFLWHITLWMMAEIILTTLGLDDLADYGEFQFAKNQPPNATVERRV